MNRLIRGTAESVAGFVAGTALVAAAYAVHQVAEQVADKPAKIPDTPCVRVHDEMTIAPPLQESTILSIGDRCAAPNFELTVAPTSGNTELLSPASIEVIVRLAAEMAVTTSE